MNLHKEKLIEAASVIFALLFIYTGAIKLMDTDRFYSGMTQSPIIPSSFLSLLTYTIPVGEIIIAALLLATRTRKAGLYIFFISMFVFTIYVAVILFYTSHVPCTCGGFISEMGWTGHLVFNTTFTLLSLGCLFLYPKQKAPRFNSVLTA
jgi:hypothetical protein